MGQSIRKPGSLQAEALLSLGALIHEHVRQAIELAVREELASALGAAPYQRGAERRGYRNGWKARTLTGPTGPLALTLPRATLFRESGAREWTSAVVARYQRRLPEVNAAIVGTYLAGGNTRRIRGALAPLLKTAPLSKSAVSRLVTTLKAPVLCIIDGHAGLRRAVGLVWPAAAVQRCCVHKLRNLERKAPKHVLGEVRDDFHRIVYAEGLEAARTAFTAFERQWTKRCPGVVRSLQEGGAELLTFFSFPRAQSKTLRTTNVIERLNEEFRRRVKTQGALPTEDAAGVPAFRV